MKSHCTYPMDLGRLYEHLLSPAASVVFKKTLTGCNKGV